MSELGPQGNVRSVGVSLSGSRALSSVLLLSGQTCEDRAFVDRDCKVAQRRSS